MRNEYALKKWPVLAGTLVIDKRLYEELRDRFDTMAGDPMFRQDNADSIDRTDSILQKIEDGIFQFTLEEVMEIWDEVVSCEDMDFWQDTPMKVSVKKFFIENTFCWTKEKYEIDNMVVCSSSNRRKYDYKLDGKYYVCKDRAEVYDMLFPSKPTSFTLSCNV